jgi:predicted molibdopterin-dependent oxidoreductase YjgC
VGKATFTPVEYSLPMEITESEYPFILLTGRDSPHAHTGTMARRLKTLSTIVPEAYAEINPVDAAASDLKNGEKVNIASRRGVTLLKAYIMDRGSKRGF